MTTVTVLSADTLTQPFRTVCPGAAAKGVLGIRRRRSGAANQPITRAPAAPTLPRMKWRRLICIYLPQTESGHRDALPKGFEAGGTIVRAALAGKRERHRTMTVNEIAQPV